MATLQVKGSEAVCSSMGTVEELTKIKNLSLKKRMEMLEECRNKYGVKSTEFYILVKPLIAWTCYQHLHGMPFSEDLLNFAYIDVCLAFEGGYTNYYNHENYYVAPKYGKTKHTNIGLFIMYIVGSAVSKYRSKNFKRQTKYEYRDKDLYDIVSYTDFEQENDLTSEVSDEIDVSHFNYFSFNKKFKRHLERLTETRPSNNVLYNFMLWRNKCFN